jgi:hypothetical protein
MYENRRVKPVEIVLRGGGRMKEDGKLNVIKIHYNHIYKCYNVSLLYNYYMLIKNLKRNVTVGKTDSHEPMEMSLNQDRRPGPRLCSLTPEPQFPHSSAREELSEPQANS